MMTIVRLASWGSSDSKALGRRSPGQLFDRAGRSGHLAAMVTTGASTNPVVALAQQTPLPVTIDQDTALVEDPIQKQRRVGLHSLQLGNVNRTAGDALQADGELKPRRGTIVGERDQQVDVGARVLVAARQRTVEHGQTHAVLIAQRTAKTGDERPVIGKVLALTRCKPQPSRSDPGSAQSALRSSPAQRALLDI
jgi:hypothetical protein